MEEEALREAMEDAFLEGAVQWRADTILQTLGMDKLGAWIRGAGLADDIEALKSEIEKVMATVSYVKGRAVGNRLLARSLAALKQKLFDADDAVDELDYHRLRHQVELEGGQHPLPSLSNMQNCFASDGVTQPCTPATMTTPVTLQQAEGIHEAARVDHGTSRDDDNIPATNGRGKKRSKAWDDFDEIKDDNGKTVQAECRHCKKRVQYKGAQGTRVLITHVNSAYCKNTREARPQPPSHSSVDGAAENATPVAVSNSSSRIRMRTNQEPTQITTVVAHYWNKDEISSSIQKITHQLQSIRGDVTKDLNMLGSHSGASSVHHQSTASDRHRRTSSLLQGKVYGRDAEKNSIINRMADARTDSVTVLPIVGIGGTGKTALAQFVFNDPNVQKQFDHSIWVWVSNSLDEMRITREMLDVVPREKHEGLCSLDKLQQVLKTHIESKRVLLILDDVWDDMNDGRMDLILASLKSDNAKGNVILVTTRYLSVAKRIGTTEPVVLGALKGNDLWLLLKARAFRDENNEGNGNLANIGRKIACKLKGNPLAAVTAGELLRVDLTVDHWNKILKDEDGKLLGRSGRIMASLKLSYDQLPYHLHQCFSYCSIFPNNYEFLGEELVHIWISQGFVTRTHSSKRLEDIGMDYLADLVNLGYFQQVERKDSSLGSQNSYVVSGLMHDFARMVSRAECGIVDGLQCNDILSTVQHLAVVYKKDQHGNMSCSRKFEDDLRNAVTSMRKLRTLLLIGQYDRSFFQSFKDIFQKARDIRLLQISATFEDFNSLMCSSVNPTHLRYVKFIDNEEWGHLRQVLSNFCHLQVLDVGSNTDLDVPHGMNSLVSLRHLVAASIARIGKLTSLQKLNNFRIQDFNGFQIIELQSMNELVQLGISQLQYVETQEEACRAGLRYKRHLEKLHLSWDGSNEYDSDGSNESENVMSSEPSTSKETEECLPTVVLAGLEPHNNLKHLQITGYNGATSPSWFSRNISVTSLQTLHLEDCRKWQILPSLNWLPFLTKLKLSGMPKVVEVSVPSLEELALIKMPKLETCSCIFWREMNSCLRVLKIEKCPALKVFDLFGNGHEFVIEQKPWLPRLCELIIHKCPLLLVPHLLPSSSTVSRISMGGVSNFPRIDSRSGGRLTIGKDLEVDDSDSEYDSDEEGGFDRFSDNLSVLDGNILAFHNPRYLKKLIISGCRNLTSISFKGLSQLVSLKKLRILDCPRTFSFAVPPDHTHEDFSKADTHEDLIAANWNALPSLEYLKIVSCGITWEWLSLILQHAPALTELYLVRCPNLESLQLNSCTTLQKLTILKCDSLGTIEVLQSRSLRYMEVKQVPKLKSLQLHFCTALEELVIEGTAVCVLEGSQSLRKLKLYDNQYLESLQLYSCAALEELIISGCRNLTSISFKGLSQLVSLKKLRILDCPRTFSFAVPPDHTHEDFSKADTYEDLIAANWNALPSLEHLEIVSCGITWEWLSLILQHAPALTELDLFRCPNLESLQLNSCTTLQELSVRKCDLLGTIEVLQSRSLRDLEVREVPNLKSLELHFCTALEKLVIEETAVCVLEGSQSLRMLELYTNQYLESLKLYSCAALEELNIGRCTSLSTLEGFQSLGSLRRLYLRECPGLHSCLEGLAVQDYELCPQLEFLGISDFSFLATSFCRQLTSLQRLFISRLFGESAPEGLTDEQERGLLLLGSLTELQFAVCDYLPAGLHRFRSLQVLEISYCSSISGLPGLPPSLEELRIYGGSEELIRQSKSLASSKLKVKIGNQYVN